MEKEKYIPLEIEIIEWDDEDIITASDPFTKGGDGGNETGIIKAFRPFEPYQIGDKEDGE
ncbi:MAG: hypothetical protein II779_03785 [Clostridia bacterium]|nr:hypothetical protein [Clostridia bacterium]